MANFMLETHIFYLIRLQTRAVVSPGTFIFGLARRRRSTKLELLLIKLLNWTSIWEEVLFSIEKYKIMNLQLFFPFLKILGGLSTFLAEWNPVSAR